MTQFCTDPILMLPQFRVETAHSVRIHSVRDRRNLPLQPTSAHTLLLHTTFSHHQNTGLESGQAFRVALPKAMRTTCESSVRKWTCNPIPCPFAVTSLVTLTTRSLTSDANFGTQRFWAPRFGQFPQEFPNAVLPKSTATAFCFALQSPRQTRTCKSQAR